eukprot:TRINITY_DN7782_c0_g1_i2.p1 TRINITY_DN7782_c0_g1~~TRINITY_DN7782_c0_g1_i2.p1  ORF type:complete len:145 (+),score=17.07 TRINITY_DN7782_c0_g1_i2:94-528(+)
MLLVLFFFFNDPATTEIYTLHIVGSVRCVQETGLNLQRPSTISISFGCISFKIPRCSNRNKFICRSLTPNIYEGIFLQHHIIRKYGRKLNCCIGLNLSLIHISEPTRLGMISYAVFCLKKKKRSNTKHSTKHTKDQSRHHCRDK